MDKSERRRKGNCQDITQLEVKNNSIILKTFFEAPKEIKGRIREIDFLKGKVVIESDELL